MSEVRQSVSSAAPSSSVFGQGNNYNLSYQFTATDDNMDSKTKEIKIEDTEEKVII